MSPIDGKATIKSMFSVNDLAKHYDISPNTLKNWASEFRDYLGNGANANPRFYVENDLQVLNLVSHLRQQNKPYTEIHKALEQGDRLEATPENIGTNEPETDKPNNELMTRLTATVARFEGELTATKQERDRLITDLESERLARLDAVERATRAETQADMLRAQLDEMTAQPAPTPPSQDASDDTGTDPAPAPRRWWHIFKSGAK